MIFWAFAENLSQYTRKKKGRCIIGYSHCWILAFFAGIGGTIYFNMFVGFLLMVVVCFGLMFLTYKLLYGG
jgi:hypothetical protein